MLLTSTGLAPRYNLSLVTYDDLLNFFHGLLLGYTGQNNLQIEYQIGISLGLFSFEGLSEYPIPMGFYTQIGLAKSFDRYSIRSAFTPDKLIEDYPRHYAYLEFFGNGGSGFSFNYEYRFCKHFSIRSAILSTA